jgi:O-antigen ligase
MRAPGMMETDTLTAEPLPQTAVVATGAERLARRVLQAGAVLVVLLAVTWRDFELDRFFVPKELVLHATALLAGLALLRSLQRLVFTRIDLLLLVFLALSTLSAVLAANGWYAARALAISASGIVIFWCARILTRAGLGRGLLHAAATAAVLGVLTALLQTYGVTTDIFSINRAPGGTLGNRNFIAHMAAFSLPVTLLIALRTRSSLRSAAAMLGATLLAATLVLTRSRAGLLALAAVLVVFAAALLLAPALRRTMRVWVRLLLMLIVAAAGVTAAVLTPNALNWRGENPYMESITGVANYQEGSGRGRLVQYRRSADMAVSHPLLGVGPGNWAVRYPEFAVPGDPSLDRRQAGTTSNPWPSSDWVAFVSERGLVAAIALALVLLALALSALRRARTVAAADDALAGTALIATIAAVAISGLFDAVLLLALPTVLVWLVIGVLWPGAPSTVTGALQHEQDTETYPDPERARRAAPAVAVMVAFAITLFLALVGTVRSTAQLVAMGVYANSRDVTWLQRAARVDPGSYRLQIRLARPGSGLARAERCEHARAARDLQPEAREARNLARGC